MSGYESIRGMLDAGVLRQSFLPGNHAVADLLS